MSQLRANTLAMVPITVKTIAGMKFLKSKVTSVIKGTSETVDKPARTRRRLYSHALANDMSKPRIKPDNIFNAATTTY
nr:hypothetical protein [Pseudobacteroides cellulosolvens]